MRYLVDSFQLFFSCDRHMVDHMYENNLQNTIKIGGKERSTMPILYCDNTISTISKAKHLRKYAYPSKFFGSNPLISSWRNEWSSQNERWIWKGVEIPSEEFFVEVEDLGEQLRISMDDTSQYHLEFQYKLDSNMGSWENWFALYFPVPTMIQLLKDLGIRAKGSRINPNLIHEKKQTSGKREDFYYQGIGVDYYQFTYESFSLANDFLKNQGFNGNYLGLVHEEATEHFQPFMKVGYVNTKETDGDYERNPQIAVKLSQRILHDNTRRRGTLKTLTDKKNYILVNKKSFTSSVLASLYILHKKDLLKKAQ